MISEEQWQEYKDYLQSLTVEEIQIELQWLKSVGIAKQRGSTVAFTQTDTLQQEYMLAPHEETQILRGIDEIMHNLRHVPVDDVAHFLVKFNPKLADELASAIHYKFFDNFEGKNHE